MRYEAIFKSLPVPIALVDADLNVRDASEAYARLAGAGPAAVVGTPLCDGFAQVGPESGFGDAARRALAEGRPFDWTMPGADGGPPSSALRVRILPVDGGERGLGLAIVTEVGQGDGRLQALYHEIRAIKHEINNPLTGALGNITLLLRRSDLDEKTRRRLATAEQEMKKVSQLVLRLADLVPSTEARTTDTSGD